MRLYIIDLQTICVVDIATTMDYTHYTRLYNVIHPFWWNFLHPQPCWDQRGFTFKAPRPCARGTSKGKGFGEERPGGDVQFENRRDISSQYPLVN